MGSPATCRVCKKQFRVPPGGQAVLQAINGKGDRGGQASGASQSTKADRTSHEQHKLLKDNAELRKRLQAAELAAGGPRPWDKARPVAAPWTRGAPSTTAAAAEAGPLDGGEAAEVDEEDARLGRSIRALEQAIANLAILPAEILADRRGDLETELQNLRGQQRARWPAERQRLRAQRRLEAAKAATAKAETATEQAKLAAEEAARTAAEAGQRLAKAKAAEQAALA